MGRGRIDRNAIPAAVSRRSRDYERGRANRSVTVMEATRVSPLLLATHQEIHAHQLGQQDILETEACPMQAESILSNIELGVILAHVTQAPQRLTGVHQHRSWSHRRGKRHGVSLFGPADSAHETVRGTASDGVLLA